MAITELFSGSADVNSTTISMTLNSAGTTAQPTDGAFQLWLDLSNMTSSSSFDVAFWEKVTSGGTQRKFWTASFQGSQGVPIWVSPTVILMNGWDMTIVNTMSTASVSADRHIDWSIRQLS